MPDIDRPIGGVKQLYRHVEHLSELGWDAAVLTEEDGFRPSWFTSTAKVISLSKSFLLGELSSDRCILVFPETYVGANLTDFRGYDLSACRRVIFNQNAYYTYGQLTVNDSDIVSSFYDDDLTLHVLSVSDDSHTFLLTNLGIPDSKLSRIVNAIEPCFTPSFSKSKSIHWMPRKNPDHVQSILLALKRSPLRNSAGWSGQPLENMSHLEVARKLSSGMLFLSFGHPEGFGLPIAEAMASGCWVVGYSGGGGNELFRYGASTLVSFGDWSGFLSAVQSVLDSFANNPRDTEFRIQRQSHAIRNLYSIEQERISIEVAWDRIALSFQESFTA